MPPVTSLPATEPSTPSASHLPEYVQAAQRALTSEQRVSVDFLTWEILGLLDGKTLDHLDVAFGSAGPRPDRVDLSFQLSNGEHWVCGIRYGETLQHPGFPSRHMFDFDSFFAAPTDPESCRLVMVDLRECLTTAAQVALALQQANPAINVRWLMR